MQNFSCLFSSFYLHQNKNIIFQSASENDKYCQCPQNFDLSLFFLSLKNQQRTKKQSLKYKTFQNNKLFIKDFSWLRKWILPRFNDFKVRQFFCHLCCRCVSFSFNLTELSVASLFRLWNQSPKNTEKIKN